jgi:hypothetical protein
MDNKMKNGQHHSHPLSHQATIPSRHIIIFTSMCHADVTFGPLMGPTPQSVHFIHLKVRHQNEQIIATDQELILEASDLQLLLQLTIGRLASAN